MSEEERASHRTDPVFVNGVKTAAEETTELQPRARVSRPEAEAAAYWFVFQLYFFLRGAFLRLPVFFIAWRKSTTRDGHGSGPRSISRSRRMSECAGLSSTFERLGNTEAGTL